MAMIFVPRLPEGTDVYPHVLWTWQVARCLADGQLPTWLPDLNAGFGSPGIRLYAPAGPLLAGALALVFGDVGRGIRAALLLAAVALAVVARRYRMGWAAPLLLLAPVVVFEGFFRFPVSQLLAMPVLTLFLLRGARRRDATWEIDALLLAALWLLHTLSAAVAVPLGAVLAASRRGGLGPYARSLVAAAALTMWHWLPLALDTRGSSFADALTTAELHPSRNFLGTPAAHALDHNLALGWAALGILGALLVAGVWRSLPALLAVGCVGMASLLAAPLWAVLEMLAWFQFPWRWLLPATILAVVALGEAPVRRRNLATAVLLAPLLAPPPLALAGDPRLAPRSPWPEAGRRVLESFEGNPLLVDVIEHRPPWWTELGPTLARFADRQVLLIPPAAGAVRVLEARAARRSFLVTAHQPCRVVPRLLYDGHFRASVDGVPATVERWGAAVSVLVPAGRHTVTVAWVFGWPALVGAAVAAVATLVLAAVALRRSGAAAPP